VNLGLNKTQNKAPTAIQLYSSYYAGCISKKGRGDRLHILGNTQKEQIEIAVSVQTLLGDGKFSHHFRNRW